MDAAERADALRAHEAQSAGCERCGLVEGRAQVVVGGGGADADLMIVGEAPGYAEEQVGAPFAGQARELIERLLAANGIPLEDVYLTTVLKCRPPQNRDPREDELAACEPILFRQIGLVRPRVIATLGNVATRLLSGRPQGITQVRAQEREVTVGDHRCLVYPLYHPAAALYTPAMLEVLERDVARLPELLGREPAPKPEPTPAPPLVFAEPELVRAETVQLGLF